MNKPIKIVVKELSPDSFSRPRLRNVVSGAIYVNIEMESSLRGSGWYTCSDDGEPEAPLRSEVELVLFQNTEYAKNRSNP